MGGETPPSQVVVSDLLSSAAHAIYMTGKTVDDVSLIFNRFYNVEEVEDAREKLRQIGVSIPKRSTRKDTAAKQKDIEEILKLITGLDWQGKNIKFAALNLTRICYVPDNIHDEIQLRSEVATLHKKVEDLENLCRELLNVVSAVNNTLLMTNKNVVETTDAFKAYKPDAQIIVQPAGIITSPVSVSVPVSSAPKVIGRMTGITYAEKLKRAENPQHRQPTLSQLSPSDRRHPDRVRQNAEYMSDWKTVLHRKKKSKPPNIGKAECSILTVKPVKVSSIFVSRCTPSTAATDLKEYLENAHGWTVPEVIKLNSRHNRYSSFRVDVIRKGENPESEYLKEEFWPANSLIKRFNRRPSNKLGSLESGPLSYYKRT